MPSPSKRPQDQEIHRSQNVTPVHVIVVFYNTANFLAYHTYQLPVPTSDAMKVGITGITNSPNDESPGSYAIYITANLLYNSPVKD